MVISQSQELSDLLASFGEHSGLERMNVVFFSTHGDPRHNSRSLADMLAGGDYDGDEVQIIVWQELVRLCVNESPPYEPDAPLLSIVNKSHKGNKKGNLCACELCTTTATRKAKEVAEAAKTAAAQEAVAQEAAAQAAAAQAAKTVRKKPAVSAQAAQVASAAERESRGKQQLEQKAAQLEQEAAHRRQEQERAAEQLTRAKEMDVALISNFLMAKFMSSPMVGTSANNWMILTAKYADKGGCSHPECLHLAHEYLQALDAEGRERLEKHFYRHLPKSLRPNELPAHLEDIYLRRIARSKVSVKLMPREKDTSLLAQLWDLDCGVGGFGPVRPDPDLVMKQWPDLESLMPSPREAAQKVSHLFLRSL